MGVRYSFSTTSVTLTNTSDTTNLANATYLALLQGGNGTMRLNIAEVYLGGEAPSASSVTTSVLSRDSTVATATVSGGRNAALDASSTAPGTLATVGNSTSGTVPQRSSTLHLLHLSFNAYGGIVRWVARPGEEPSVVGNTASLGEVSLSGFGASGTSGPISSHVLYEVA